MVDPNEFKNLPPEERIKRLKDLGEEKKKEIEVAEQLIKQSETELMTEKESKRKVPLEQLRSVDMDHLVSGEEKTIFKINRFKAQKEPDLEEMATEAGSQERQRQYIHEDLSKEPIDNIYTKAQEIYSAINNPQEVSRDDFYSAMDISYAIQAKETAIKKGTYSPTETLERETNAIKGMVDEIINWYKG